MRNVPRVFTRPGFRAPNARPPVRMPFPPSGGIRFRPVARTPFRAPLSSTSRSFRQPFRPFAPPFRQMFAPGFRRPFAPVFRPQFVTPLGMRRDSFFRRPFRRPFERPFQDRFGRGLPPTGGFGPPDADPISQVPPDRLVRLIQSLLNRLNGSNLPTNGVMNGATLDAMNQFPPEESQPPAEAVEAAAGAPEQAGQPLPSGEAIPASTGEAEYFMNAPEFENEFESFDIELIAAETDFPISVPKCVKNSSAIYHFFACVGMDVR